jgi:hypothetical protein
MRSIDSVRPASSHSFRTFSRAARRLAGLGAVVCVAQLGAACAAPVQDAQDTPAGTEDISYVSSQLAYYNAAVLWTQNGGIVPVCWMPSSFNWAAEKQVIQNAVTRQWGRAANLSFLGWGDCPTSGTDKFIKIGMPGANLGDSFGQTRGPGGMGIMGGPSSDWSVNIGLSPDHTTPQSRTEYIAVHEFGHVLGFIHEQDRPDAPTPGSPIYCNNSIEKVPVSYATSYDPQSIMNYCGPNNGVISPLDIVGVQKLYGRKHSGALVGDGGLCANIWGGSPVNGANVASFRCQLNQANDTWQFAASASGATLVSALGGCRMGLASYSEPVGSLLLAEGCGRSLLPGPTSFTLKNARIVGNGNKCLDTQGPYTQVVMRACNGSASQQWTYDGARFLNGDTSRGQQCLDLSNGADVAGNAVLSWSCNGGTNQNWAIAAGGFIGPQGSAHVLDVQAASVNDGTPVQIWNYQGSLNQKWFIRMSLQSANGLVLDQAGPASTSEGRDYSLWTANGGPNQEFDFYP